MVKDMLDYLAVNRGDPLGFAYDDVGGFSSSLHTEKPTIATVTVGW